METTMEKRLLSFGELARALRRHGRISRGEATLRVWAVAGVQRQDGQVVRLRSVKMGRSRRSTMQWVDEFLRELEPS